MILRHFGTSEYHCRLLWAYINHLPARLKAYQLNMTENGSNKSTVRGSSPSVMSFDICPRLDCLKITHYDGLEMHLLCERIILHRRPLAA